MKHAYLMEKNSSLRNSLKIQNSDKKTEDKIISETLNYLKISLKRISCKNLNVENV